MTERYGSGYGDEGGQRPSGRGAVTERLARHHQGAHEIDLTDEATRPHGDQTDLVSSGAFEPTPPTEGPPADDARSGSASIFDVGERARQEDLDRTGYEPAVSDADPVQPRGQTNVTDPGEPRDEPAEGGPEASRDQPAPITPTPVPVTDPAAAPVEGLPEPPSGTPPSPAPTAGDRAEPLLGSLDAGEVRNRFLDIQAGFVDEPRQAVAEASRFVDDLVRQVADALQAQRSQLAGASGEGSTEDLRLTLRAYRQFVDRLLGLVS